METILKIHSTKPIIIDLPKKEKLELFLEYYEIDDSDKISTPYHRFKGFYFYKESFNFLTDKIIDFYINKQFRKHIKLFSVDGNVKLKIDKR
jgi:hypothetical protein